VLPAIRVPANRAQFPAFRREDLTIELGRSEGEGGLHYLVRIEGGGKVEIVIFAGGLIEGTHDYRIPVERVDRLAAMFRAAGFWSLAPSYGPTSGPGRSESLGVRVGETWHRVEESDGAVDGMPPIVDALQDAVDDAAQTARWVKGDEHSIAILEAMPHFSYDSELGTRLLFALTARDAPEALALQVLDRGVPIDAPSPCSICPETSTRDYLFSAIIRNRRLALFRRLNSDESFARILPGNRNRLLAEAAGVHSLYLVERLLARGASANPPRNPMGQDDPLIAALRQGPDKAAAEGGEQEAVVRFLLSHGADVRARDGTGQIALQHAYDDEPLFARLLLQAGADVNAATPDRAPILYLTDDEDIALIALAAGADRTLRDEDGYDLAEIARRKRWPRVERLLAGGR
jgi:hypothetical protein